MAGYVPNADNLTIRPKLATTKLAERALGAERSNIQVYIRLSQSTNSELVNAGRRKTPDGIKRGWVARPQLITPGVLKTIPLTHRFPIIGDRGPGAKRRLIDDYKMSGINDAIHLEETPVPKIPNTA